jgi:glycosidase
MGVPFECVAVGIEGFPLPEITSTVPLRVHRVSQQQLQNFAESFGHEAGCSDSWLALEALHGAMSELPHIYDGTEIRLVNNAYDERRNAMVGPANWSLVDSEQFTAINRWLLLLARPGAPQLLRWSPELMAAQLDSSQWREWLRAASRPMAPAARTTWLNQAVRLRLSLDAFPGRPMTISMGARRKDPAFAAFMRSLSARMSRRDVSFANQHCWPLDRLAERLGVAFNFPIGAYREVYGHVAAA